MKKALFVLFLIIVVLVLVNSASLSQKLRGKGVLRGTITDEEGNLIEGVTVKFVDTVSGTSFETKSDKEGYWSEKWIARGMYHLDFMKVGYETKKISIKVTELQKNEPVEVVLRKVEGIVLTENLIEVIHKGNVLFNQEKYDEALAIYEKAIAENPDAYIINKNIANTYFAMKKYDLAIEYYKKVAEKQENNTSTAILIGNSYINMNKNEEALEWYGKTDVEDIEDIIALYNIGVLFFNNYEFDKSITYLEQAVKVDAQHADSFYQLGMVYLAAGRNDDAVSIFEKFLVIEPDTERTETAKSVINMLK